MGKGFDRGALVSSLDVAGLGQAAMESTFLMSVITPQHPLVNRRSWLAVEELTRRRAQEGNEVFAISGPILDVSDPPAKLTSAGPADVRVATFGRPPVFIPGGFFRILALVPAVGGEVEPAEVIPQIDVFLVPNDPNAAKRSSLNPIEFATGLHFLGHLPLPIGQQVRRQTA
jgi:DNA/RNA endonuclease G (NUC1)